MTSARTNSAAPNDCPSSGSKSGMRSTCRHSSCHAGGGASVRRITAMTSSLASWGSIGMNTPSRYAYHFRSTPSYAVSLSASRAAGTPRRSSREDRCTRTVAFLLRGFRMKAALDADRHPVPSEAGSGPDFLLRPTIKAYKNCNKGTSLLQLRKRSDQMRNSSPRRWKTVWSSRSA